MGDKLRIILVVVGFITITSFVFFEIKKDKDRDFQEYQKIKHLLPETVTFREWKQLDFSERVFVKIQLDKNK